jgi:large-conductance mechanosensitive channel
MLSAATLEDGTIDLANSIYIDWGAFISAIINFLLIAIVLFTIVRIINRVNSNWAEMKKETKELYSKENLKLLRQGKTRKQVKEIIKQKKLEIEEEIFDYKESVKTLEEKIKELLK